MLLMLSLVIEQSYSTQGAHASGYNRKQQQCFSGMRHHPFFDLSLSIYK